MRSRSRFTPEQIIGMLREAGVALAQGADGGPGVPHPGHCRADFLPLAPGVWRFKGGAGQAAEGLGTEERPSQAGGGGPDPGQVDFIGSSQGKLLSPTRRGRGVYHVRQVLGVSERRVCLVLC
jgi:hypothetical protein